MFPPYVQALKLVSPQLKLEYHAERWGECGEGEYWMEGTMQGAVGATQRQYIQQKACLSVEEQEIHRSTKCL